MKKHVLSFVLVFTLLSSLCSFQFSAQAAETFVNVVHVQNLPANPDWGNFLMMNTDNYLYNRADYANAEQITKATMSTEVLQAFLSGITVTSNNQTYNLKDYAADCNPVMTNNTWNPGTFNPMNFYLPESIADVDGTYAITIQIAEGTVLPSGLKLEKTTLVYDPILKEWSISPIQAVSPSALLLLAGEEANTAQLTITYGVAPMSSFQQGKNESDGSLANVEDLTSTSNAYRASFINSLKTGVSFNGKTLQNLMDSSGKSLTQLVDVTLNSWNGNLVIKFLDASLLNFDLDNWSSDLYEIRFNSNFILYTPYCATAETYYFDAEATGTEPQWVSIKPVREEPTTSNSDTSTTDETVASTATNTTTASNTSTTSGIKNSPTTGDAGKTGCGIAVTVLALISLTVVSKKKGKIETHEN